MKGFTVKYSVRRIAAPTGNCLQDYIVITEERLLSAWAGKFNKGVKRPRPRKGLFRLYWTGIANQTPRNESCSESWNCRHSVGLNSNALQATLRYGLELVRGICPDFQRNRMWEFKLSVLVPNSHALLSALMSSQRVWSLTRQRFAFPFGLFFFLENGFWSE